MLEQLASGLLREMSSPAAVLWTNAQLLEHVLLRSREIRNENVRVARSADIDNAIGILESVRASQQKACERLTRTLDVLRLCLGPPATESEPEAALVDVGEILVGVIHLLVGVTGRVRLDQKAEGDCRVEGSRPQLGYLFLVMLSLVLEAAGTEGVVAADVRCGRGVVEVALSVRESGSPSSAVELPGVTRWPERDNGTTPDPVANVAPVVLRRHGGRLEARLDRGRIAALRVRLPRAGFR